MIFKASQLLKFNRIVKMKNLAYEGHLTKHVIYAYVE